MCYCVVSRECGESGATNTTVARSLQGRGSTSTEEGSPRRI